MPWLLAGLLRSAGKVRGINVGGQSFLPTVVQKTLSLELSASPQYVVIEDGPD